MTREEILAMQPGRELDALIAEKVMGWVVYRGESPNHYDLVDDDEYAHGFPPGEGVMGVPFEINEYSNFISAAWEVVERMNGEYGFLIQRLNDYWDLGDDWEGWEASFGGHSNRLIRAQTAPEAICKAALIALMEEGASAIESNESADEAKPKGAEA